MNRIKFPVVLPIFLPCFTFLVNNMDLKASPAARAIAYHTTLRFLNLQSGFRTNFFKNMTQSMLSSVEATSKNHNIPINAHLKASSLAWRNARDGEKNAAEVYDNSYEIALNYLSDHGTELKLLDEAFDSFECELENITRPW